MTNKFRITKTGEYRTRDGRKAVVLCTDAPDNNQPIVGYIISEYGSLATSWAEDGDYGSYDDYEVIGRQRDIISEWVEPEVIRESYHLMQDMTVRRFNDCIDTRKIIGNFTIQLTTNPDGKQYLEILEQVNRGDV